MRVALLEPFPRMCGVTKWTFEAVHGFRALGHEAHVVSFTKSGRPRTTSKKDRAPGVVGNGLHWWPQQPDVVQRWDDAPDVLAGYDLVVLNEPRNGSADREVRRSGGLPLYVEALRATRAPWLTVLHSPQYHEKGAPFLAELLASPGFTGYVVEHAESYASGRWAFDGHVRKLQAWPWLPYRPRGKPDVPREWVIGFGGRMSPNKGFVILAYLADRLPAHYEVRLFGTEPGGTGPASTYLAYEALFTHHGWSGERRGQRADPQRLNNYGDVQMCWPWWLSKVDEAGQPHVLRYEAGYVDQLSAWARCAIATNLTSSEFVTGLEYTALEAMDADCALVIPRHALGRTGVEQYNVHLLDRYGKSFTISQKTGVRSTGTEVEAEFVEVVTRADEVVRSGQHDPAVNRRALEQYHDPVHLARTILEGVQ